MHLSRFWAFWFFIKCFVRVKHPKDTVKHFIYLCQITIHISKCRFLQMSFSSYPEPHISTSLTHTTLYICIPVWILKGFTEGSVHISLTWLYTAFYSPKNGENILFSENYGVTNMKSFCKNKNFETDPVFRFLYWKFMQISTLH